MPDFTYEIEDIELARQGLERINWVRERMPVLRQIKQDFGRTRPFAGMRIGICLLEVMDLGLALQSLSLAYLAADSQSLPAGPQTVPKEIENEVAVRTLHAWS